MQTVKISPKFQIVIPKQIRKQMNLQAGQSMNVFAFGNRIELVPDRDISELMGFVKGIDIQFERDSDRL